MNRQRTAAQEKQAAADPTDTEGDQSADDKLGATVSSVLSGQQSASIFSSSDRHIGQVFFPPTLHLSF